MKINSKQLQGFYRARKEIISNNDDYNKDIFNITLKEYGSIKRAFYNIFGILGGSNRASLARVNKELETIN